MNENRDSKDKRQFDVYKSKKDSLIRAISTVTLLLICMTGISLFEGQFRSINLLRVAAYVVVIVFCAWMLFNLPKTFPLVACIVLAGLAAGAFDAINNFMTPKGNTKTTRSTGVPYVPQQLSGPQARSLTCRDGMVLAYCQVQWSDGSYRPLPFGVGPRLGGVVDAIIYYDLQWNPSCILLYADGSIVTSYDTGKCS